MPSHLPDLAGARVLVIEDEYFIADDLSRALQAHGATVIGPAPTLAEARRLIGAGGIDLAVLDINLEGELAYPLADQLAIAGVPFVVASGYGESALAQAVPANAHLEKPCSAERLTDLVFELLGSRESER